MGIEYRLRFQSPDPEAVADLLRRLPGVRETAPADRRFDLGADPSGSGWPEAFAWIDAEGLLFCDNCGGGGRDELGRLLAKLASHFGPVTVEEL